MQTCGFRLGRREATRTACSLIEVDMLQVVAVC